MKYYNVELNYTDAELLKDYLKINHLKYEASSAGNLIHFEIELDDYGYITVEEFLNTL